MRHKWIAVLYNSCGEEQGWLCTRCGLNAQLYPEQHMAHRNSPTALCNAPASTDISLQQLHQLSLFVT